MIFETILNKKASEIKRDADTFSNEHPLALCLIVGMGAVIFAQHIELNCYRIVTAQR